MEKVRKKLNEQPSYKAQERLIEIMNDSPRVKSFAGTEWEIRALKPGTQWLIAQEAAKVCGKDSNDFSEVIIDFSKSAPSVCNVITLCLLNDRHRIFENGKSGKYSEEFEDTFQTLMWETDHSKWMDIFVEVMNMLDVEVFFSIINSIQILRQTLLERKVTMEEQRRLSLERSGDK